MNFIAYTTKGLEFVAEREIKSKIPDVKILEVLDKRIIFDSNASFGQLTGLRTVDDLGMLVLSASNVGDINSFISAIYEINFSGARKELDRYRQTFPDNFSITTSLVGVKGSTAPDLVTKLSQNIRQKYGWNFTELDHTNFDVRVFIDHNIGYVSVRLTKNSLSHRAYKTSSKLGSLKSTVAAAMVYLATERKTSLEIVDNFCGSGTILAEAFLMGNEVYGGDIDPESVEITKENLSHLKYPTEGKVKQVNALGTNWPSNFFDCAISNLPWGKQVEIESVTKLYEGALREFARTLKPGGVLCALVSKPELFVKFVKKYFPDSTVEQFKIGLLGQKPTIVLAN